MQLLNPLSKRCTPRDEQFLFLLLWMLEVRRLKGCYLVTTFLLKLLSDDPMLCVKNMNTKIHPKKHL
jgi:hypothetical protein